MPLLIGSGAKTLKKNIATLIRERMGKVRGKAVKTIAKKEGISTKKAKIKQAVAIAYSLKKK